MKKIKLFVSSFLLLGLLSLSGCFVTKAGTYVSEKTKAGWEVTKEKSKAGWSATKSFFGAEE